MKLAHVKEKRKIKLKLDLVANRRDRNKYSTNLLYIT